MILPTVNLNGTSRTALVEQNFEAAQALREALDKVMEAAPHGRDYQIGPANYSQAADQFQNMVAELNGLIDHFQTMAEEIAGDFDTAEAAGMDGTLRGLHR